MTKKTYRRTVLKLRALWMKRAEMLGWTETNDAAWYWQTFNELTFEIKDLAHLLYHADPEFTYATPRMFQMFVVINRTIQFVAYEEFGSEIKIK